MKEEDQDILFYAFRYALGRRTGVVSQMVGIITNRWNLISNRTKQQIQGEIKHAISTGMAGQAVDEKEWRKILELSL